ncbi:MAG: rhombosortase [Opitutaceae bacterium]|nr:rhombosortase [Opitutaceae bacterium]
MLVEPLTWALLYERGLILQGQVWRLWTGHVVHWGASHFLWDLAVFLPAGCWLERLWPARARWFYAVTPGLISVLLLAFDPALLRYAGISGLATGTLVLLAGLQLRRRDEPRWPWIGVLALVAAKLLHELIARAPLMVQGFDGIRTVPLAHAGGVVCTGVFLWLRRKVAEPARTDVGRRS